MVERSLRMREVRGSIPCVSNFLSIFFPCVRGAAVARWLVPMRHALPMSAREDAERPSLEEWLGELAASNDVRIPSVVCRDSAHGRGLFASTRVARGDVILSVPRRLTLCVQDGAGLSLPPGGTWPRVRAGVAANAPDAGKTWEYVLARAIVDAVAGDGGDFWAAYGGLMPPPASLAHPFLLPDALLAELQDPELEEDARIERARLQTLMPDLMDPLEPGGPPVGAWALALVRARDARRQGPRRRRARTRIVPFLDLANHATAPTIDYRCDGVETPASSGLEPQATENLDRFELVALGDAESGEELRLAYTKGTLTSREHFAQYGFAPEGVRPSIASISDRSGGSGRTDRALSRGRRRLGCGRSFAPNSRSSSPRRRTEGRRTAARGGWPRADSPPGSSRPRANR